MKLILRFFSLFLLTASAFFPADAQSGNGSTQRQIFDVTKAIYDDELASDPNNYGVLLRRANLFFGARRYDEAMADIDRAIELTPTSEVSDLAQEYSLRAALHIINEQKESALQDLGKACLLEPSNYINIFAKAELDFDLGNYDEAKAGYLKLERLKNRSIESLIGLAKVAIEEKNQGLAHDYINRAVSFNPTDPEIYLIRAQIREKLGDSGSAADDLVYAVILNPESEEFIALYDFSKRNYDTAIAALSRKAVDDGNSTILLFSRATIEHINNHNSAALADFNTLIETGLYDSTHTRIDIAEILSNLCRDREALAMVDQILALEPENAEALTLKSKILLNGDNPIEALQPALKAINTEKPSYSDLENLAAVYYATGDYEKADQLLGELIIDYPDKLEYLIFRGDILAQNLNRKTEAEHLYNRAVEAVDNDTTADSLMSKSIALARLGRADEARAFIEDSEFRTLWPEMYHYFAACTCNLLGDQQQTQTHLDSLARLGFDNCRLLAHPLIPTLPPLQK